MICITITRVFKYYILLFAFFKKFLTLGFWVKLEWINGISIHFNDKRWFAIMKQMKLLCQGTAVCSQHEKMLQVHVIQGLGISTIIQSNDGGCSNSTFDGNANHDPDYSAWNICPSGTLDAKQTSIWSWTFASNWSWERPKWDDTCFFSTFHVKVSHHGPFTILLVRGLFFVFSIFPCSQVIFHRCWSYPTAILEKEWTFSLQWCPWNTVSVTRLAEQEVMDVEFLFRPPSALLFSKLAGGLRAVCHPLHLSPLSLAALVTNNTWNHTQLRCPLRMRVCVRVIKSSWRAPSQCCK